MNNEVSIPVSLDIANQLNDIKKHLTWNQLFIYLLDMNDLKTIKGITLAEMELKKWLAFGAPEGKINSGQLRSHVRAKYKKNIEHKAAIKLVELYKEEINAYNKNNNL